MGMEVLNLKQLLEWKPPDIEPVIGSGILYPDTAMILYGEAGSFKTNLSIHTAYCIATGRPWFGFKTSRKKLLLWQSEIPQAMFQKRIAKYSKQHNLYPDNIFFCSDMGVKLDRTYGLGRLMAVLQVLQPEVLVIDPLYKFISGRIEDSHDVVGFLDNMDMVKSKYHCTMIIIHHQGKYLYTSEGIIDRGAQSMMGSSYLLNWPDTRINLKSNTTTDTSLLTFDNVRHAEEILEPIRLQFIRSTLGWKVVSG